MRIAKDMSLRKILKLQKELDAFDLRTQEMNWEMQQQAVDLERQERELDLLTLWFEERRKSNQSVASPEIDQSHQGNEVAINLPPKFDKDEQEDIKEEEKEDEVQIKDGNKFEEIKLEAKEGEELTFTIPKTLNPNFCQSISEPFLKAPNLALRVFEEVVRSMSTPSPTSTIQISKGRKKKSVSRAKRDLFAWLILFQPELSPWKMIAQEI